MITDKQARRLFMLKKNQNEKLKTASLKSGMCENTARKYLKLNKLPTETKKARKYKTRKNPFSEVWEEIEYFLKDNTGIECTTLFNYLQMKYPGKFNDGQIRTLQRNVKEWKAIHGNPKEVYFPQNHHPGDLSESDFSDMSKLGITIQGKAFEHKIYHFVLTYSNWEYVSICFSESYDTLSECLQKALWKLGRVPHRHRTDCMSAVLKRKKNNEDVDRKFIDRYKALLRYYKIKAERTNPYSPNENGDIEQRHNRFKKSVEQHLILRGSKDFSNQKEYSDFINHISDILNENRNDKFKEELNNMKNLPSKKLLDQKRIKVRVTKFSTIRVENCVYSVNSRLIGEKLIVRLYSNHLDIYYSNKLLDIIPRQKGSFKHRIQYHHIIQWLVRKPGAFDNYKYKNDLFPNSRFRMVYDYLKRYLPSRANKEYVNILYLCFKEGESKVDDAIRYLLDNDRSLSYKYIAAIVLSNKTLPSVYDVEVSEINLDVYDQLISPEKGVSI